MVRAGRGRGAGRLPPPPLMSRNNGMPPMRYIPPGMRPLPPGMRSPPFAPHMPPHPPPSHMRGLPHRLPPGPPMMPHHPHRNMPPFPPRPPMMFRGPMLPPGPMRDPHLRRMPPPPLMGGRIQGAVGKKRGGQIRRDFRGKNRKGKMEEQEENFLCETCDRGFDTEETYQQHCDEHVICGREGCTLSAHPKVIEKHIVLQHESGLYKRIAKESPGDIEKWLEQRKRNYPTKKNVEQNKDKLDEMDRRGEHLHEDNSRFGKKNRGPKRGNTNEAIDNNRKSKEKRKKNPQTKTFDNEMKLKMVLKEEPERKEETWRDSIPHFPGIAFFPPEDEEDVVNVEAKEEFSDSEWDNKADETSNNTSILMSASLSALSAAYCSDSDSDMEEDKSLPVESVETSTKDDQIIASQTTNLQDSTSPSNEGVAESDENDGPPEEVKIDRNPVTIEIENTSTCLTAEQHTTERETEKDNKRVRKRQRHNKNESQANIKRTRYLIPPKRLTLLEKLLGPEIRHERNTILQCVRYVVENKFFGIGQTQNSK